jgi:O-antigen/teichoic acid export membrane protein
MSQARQSMTNRTLSGLFWMSLASGANVVSLLLVLVILARLLTPADFGLAAAALMVIGFSAIFSELGIGPALVQRSDLQPMHLRTGFTLSILLGVVAAALIWFTAPLVAAFFRLDELTPLLHVLALVFPLQGLAVVADSLLQRELRFRSLAIVETIAVVLGYGGVGITLAYSGFGASALVGAHLAQTILKTTLFLVLRPHPACPLLSRRACKDLLFFGGGFTAGRFSNYLAGQGEHLVIGRCLGAIALGVYGRAYQLMAGPAVLFGNVLDRVLFPAMAQVQDQPKRLADAYRRGTALIALLMLPTSTVLVLLSPEVVRVFLGAEWDAVTLPLQILGVGMLFRTGCKISDSLVRATGAVYSRLWRQTAYAILVVTGALIGQEWGVEGVSIAVLITLAVNFFLMAQISLYLAAMPWRIFWVAHCPGLALAILVGVPVGVAAGLLRSWSVSPLLILLISSAAWLPTLVLVARWPDLFLGRDGRWMARKLRAFLTAPAQPPVPQRTSPMKEVLQLPGNSQPCWLHGQARTNSAARPKAAQPGVNGAHQGNGFVPSASRAGGLLALLTSNLSAEGVRYCRWKRSLDLQRVLSGAGDLDLLVDPKDADNFLGVTNKLGFKQAGNCFEPEPSTQEVHLYGLDQDTGTLLHLHVNFVLFGEESPLGSSNPSLEELVLKHVAPETVPGLLEGMPVVQAQAELIVFVIRAMERYARLRAFPRLAAQRKTLQAKLHTLLAEEAAASWQPLLEHWLPAVPPALFAECLEALRGPTSWFYRYRLARRFLRHVPVGRPRTERTLLRRALAFLQAGLWRLCHGRGSPKQLSTGGAVIAIVGPDASGKSTMVAETTRWLGTVFRVKAAHLGKPPPTLLTLVPSLAWWVLRQVVPRLRAEPTQETPKDGKARSPGLFYRLRAVLLAWDRRALAIRLSRQAARGWLVVCDRYPSAVVGAPDGARLEVPGVDTNQGWLRSYLARLENRLYRDISPPKVVVRLLTPLAVATDRNLKRQKTGKESEAYLARRHKDFFLPPFGAAQTIEFDTGKSQTETIQSLRRVLWEVL